MITPALERALISGKAQMFTHMHAGAGAGRIVVPQNCFIIVHQLTLSPFSDPLRGLDEDDFLLVDERSTNIYELYCQDAPIRNAFAVRNYLFKQKDSYGNYSVVNSPPVTFDTYLVFNKTVYIAVGINSVVNNAAIIDYSNLPATTQAPPTPTGYGSSAATRQNILLADAVTLYRPTGDDSNPGPPGVTMVENQPFPNYKTTGALNNQDVNVCTPLMTVQYCLLNEQARKDFQ